MTCASLNPVADVSGFIAFLILDLSLDAKRLYMKQALRNESVGEGQTNSRRRHPSRYLEGGSRSGTPGDLRKGNSEIRDIKEDTIQISLPLWSK